MMRTPLRDSPMREEFVEKFGEKVVRVADFLDHDEEALYAFKWLWNGADADYIHWCYHCKVVARVLALAESE